MKTTKMDIFQLDNQSRGKLNLALKVLITSKNHKLLNGAFFKLIKIGSVGSQVKINEVTFKL